MHFFMDRRRIRNVSDEVCCTQKKLISMQTRKKHMNAIMMDLFRNVIEVLTQTGGTHSTVLDVQSNRRVKQERIALHRGDVRTIKIII